MSLHSRLRTLRCAVAIVIAYLACAVSSTVRAADIQWTGTTGDYNNGANWQGGVVPGAMDNAIVDNAGTVQITSDISANDLRAGDASATATGTYNQTGGTANVTSWVRIGSQGGGTVAGTGVYNLSNGSLKTGGPILLGELMGTGTMNQTGGNVTVGGGNWFSIGQGMNGTGTYNLSAGTLTVGGDFNVSDNPGSTGTLNLSGTGAITAPNVFLGKQPGAHAVVMQTGGSLTAGAGGIKAATDAASTSTYTLAGGTLDGGGKPFVTGPGTFTFTFTGGTLQNASSLSFALTQGGGTLHPSAPDQFGKMDITTGGYTQSAGATLLIDLSGANADELTTAGNVTLAGLLSLHVPGGGAIPGGTSFTIVDPASGSSTTGKFSNAISSIMADNGEMFNIVYNGGADGNDVIITAVPEPATFAAVGGLALLLVQKRRRI